MIIVVLYVLFGIGSIAFGQMRVDLLALGMEEAVFNIVSVGMNAAVLAMGTLAMAFKITLPELPLKVSKEVVVVEDSKDVR